MKLLHLADLHIGKRVYEYSMLEEQKSALLQVFQMAKEHAVDAVLIAGDVYDKTIPTIEGVKLFDTFLTALKTKQIPTFIISGNHDSAERLAFGRKLFENSEIYLSGTYEEEILKKTLSDEFGAVDVYLLPFLKPQQIEVAEGEEKPKDYTEAIGVVLKRLHIDTGRRNVLVAHQFVGGSGQAPWRADSETQSVGGVDMVDYRVFDAFDYVALGHLHGAQQVGRETVRYAGSPVKYSFSEAAQEKSATLITMGAKNADGAVDITIEKLPIIPVHDMRKIKGTLHQLTDVNVLKEGDPEDYMHITLTDEEEIYDVFGKLRAVYPNLMALEFDNARTRATGAAALAGKMIKEKSTMELFREFFKQQAGCELSPMQEQIMTDIIEKNGE